MNSNGAKMAPVTFLILGCFISGIAMFQQNDYKINYERLEVVRYDTNYIKHLRTFNFKYNRTAAACNYTTIFKVDLGSDIMVEVQGYKMASNEYRLFPIVFEFNLCIAISRNDFGLKRLYECGHFAKCPLSKGTYGFCNFVPDESKFPPHIPNGSYRFDLKFHYLSLEVQYLQFYASITRPIKIPSY